jgi:SAM-dependent methyltransferase
LDLGAGYCDFINQLKARERHALDISPNISGYAAADIVTHIGSCVKMADLADSYFDVVFSSNLPEHLSRQDSIETLNECYRILKGTGRLILMQPDFRICYKIYFDDYTHLQVFTDRGLADFIESLGFHLKFCLPLFLPFFFDLKFPFSARLFKLYLHLPFKPFAGQMLMVAEKNPKL